MPLWKRLMQSSPSPFQIYHLTKVVIFSAKFLKRDLKVKEQFNRKQHLNENRQNILTCHFRKTTGVTHHINGISDTCSFPNYVSVLLSQWAITVPYQNPETKVAEWNSGITHFIIYTCEKYVKNKRREMWKMSIGVHEAAPAVNTHPVQIFPGSEPATFFKYPWVYPRHLLQLLFFQHKMNLNTW